MTQELPEFEFPAGSSLSDEERLAVRDAANALTAHAFRNSPIEDLHAGTVPHTEAGDYSDVYVVTPKGEIPWNELSRISNDEMKTLMIRASASLAEVLLLERESPEAYDVVLAVLRHAYARGWDRTPPELPAGLVEWALVYGLRVQAAAEDARGGDPAPKKP